jgi:methionine synthase II (cobalamin-independent)
MGQPSRNSFTPDCLPVLIGSMPSRDHRKASESVFLHTPEIPVWVQLPVHHQEGMIVQFMPGFPGLTTQDEKWFIQSDGADFSDALLQFYEEYMAVTEERIPIDDSRFALTRDVAPGFYIFMEEIPAATIHPRALKGQITGPITFSTAVKDHHDRAIFYDDQIRDVAIKLLAMKARWQARQLSRFGFPVILFLDEPALAGFGSSEFISITGESVTAALNEVIDAIHAEGGYAGIHVCANTDWNVIMNTHVDIINFDAYGYFDRFILYPDALKSFWDRDGMIAWGIVPTDNPDAMSRETPQSLTALLKAQMIQIEQLGISRVTILARSFITPSCGLGALTADQADHVLELTQNVSRMIRNTTAC